jgi:hypothetical protein
MGGGWAPEFESFLGPVKWHRADRRVPFEALLGPSGALRNLITLLGPLVHKIVKVLIKQIFENIFSTLSYTKCCNSVLTTKYMINTARLLFFFFKNNSQLIFHGAS